MKGRLASSGIQQIHQTSGQADQHARLRHGVFADPERTGPVMIPESVLLEGHQPFPAPEPPQTPPSPPVPGQGDFPPTPPPGW